MDNKIRRGQEGFTAVQMLIVVGVIFILLYITLTRFPFSTLTKYYVEKTAYQIASDMRLAQRLARSEGKDFSLSFLNANEQADYPYREYRLIDKSNNTVYRGHIVELSENVNCEPLSTAAGEESQEFIFQSDGSEITYNTAGNIMDIDGGLLLSDNAGHQSRIRVTRSTGKVLIY